MRSPFDEPPEYRLDANLSPVHFQSVERDDFKDFLSRHRGHLLENLDVVEDSYVSEKAYAEPVKTSFFKATNGKEKFVIKKFRERIDEPLKYELVSGDFHLQCVSVETQAEDIVKQLAREMNPSLSQDKIDAFLKLMGALIEGVKIQELVRVPQESHHPLKVYYKIGDVDVMYLLRNCHLIFRGQEYSAIEEFIHRHKDDGVLLLKATFKIQITREANARKKAAPPPLPIENEKILRQK